MFLLVYYVTSDDALATLKGDWPTILERMLSFCKLNDLLKERLEYFSKNSVNGDVIMVNDYLVMRIRSAITIGIEHVPTIKEGTL